MNVIVEAFNRVVDFNIISVHAICPTGINAVVSMDSDTIIREPGPRLWSSQKFVQAAADFALDMF
jgi:hypothetical protein